MKENIIPKLNPRIRAASEQFLHSKNDEKRVRLELLKQQLLNGTYRPNSTTLAKSLLPTGA